MACALLTVAGLVASAHWWARAWELDRGYSDSRFGSFAPDGVAQSIEAYQAAAGFALFVAVAAWVVGGLCALSRVSGLPARRADGPAHAVLRGAVVGAVVGGVLAVPVSQYLPLAGGWSALFPPWSMPRRSLIGMHFAGMSACGAVALGLLAGLANPPRR